MLRGGTCVGRRGAGAQQKAPAGQVLGCTLAGRFFSQGKAEGEDGIRDAPPITGILWFKQVPAPGRLCSACSREEERLLHLSPPSPANAGSRSLAERR